MPALNPPQRLFPRVIRLFGPYRGQVAVVGLLILLTSGLGAVNPVLIKFIFDAALFPQSGPPDLGLLWMLAGAVALIAIGSGVLGVFQTYKANMVGQNVMGDLQDAVYGHLQGMSLNFFTRTRTGEMQSRVSNDVGGIQSVVTNTATDTISSIVVFISALIAMVVLSWQFTLVLSQRGFGICLRKEPIKLSCLVGSVEGGGGSDGQGQIRGWTGTGTTGRAPSTDPGWQKLSPIDR